MGGVGLGAQRRPPCRLDRARRGRRHYPSSATRAYQSSTDAGQHAQRAEAPKAGVGLYPGDRWGDYVGVAQDPQVPNAVWQGEPVLRRRLDSGRREVTQLQTGGTTYVPITPVRVLDTRPAYQIGLSGVFNGERRRGAGTSPASRSTAPGHPGRRDRGDRQLDVVNQTAGGYAGQARRPTANPPSRRINFPAGDVRANNVTVPLSAGRQALGRLQGGRRQDDPLHLRRDRLLPGRATARPTYATITPSGSSTPGRVRHRPDRAVPDANTPRTLSDRRRQRHPGRRRRDHGQPDGRRPDPGGLPVGHPEPRRQPDDRRTLNFPLGDVRANGLDRATQRPGRPLDRLEDDGRRRTSPLHPRHHRLLPRQPDGLQFYPLTPGRIMDTRPGVVLSRPLRACSPPARRGRSAPTATSASRTAPKAITGNLTVVGQTAAGYAVITPDPDAQPADVDDQLPARRRPRPTASPCRSTAPFDLSFVYKGRPPARTTHMILDVTGYFRLARGHGRPGRKAGPFRFA